MAFERIFKLNKKCPGYVVSGLRNASVGIATVTQESFESRYYIFGTRSLFAMTAPFSRPVEIYCKAYTCFKNMITNTIQSKTCLVESPLTTSRYRLWVGC